MLNSYTRVHFFMLAFNAEGGVNLQSPSSKPHSSLGMKCGDSTIQPNQPVGNFRSLWRKDYYYFFFCTLSRETV